MRRRREWFEVYESAYMALWWVPAGHRPTIEEAKERLACWTRRTDSFRRSPSDRRSMPPA